MRITTWNGTNNSKPFLDGLGAVILLASTVLFVLRMVGINPFKGFAALEGGH